MGSLLYWSPRILAILFAAFVTIFALDVFEHSKRFWPIAFSLLIHLIPTAIVLAALAMAWRWEWLGAIVFSALALLYLVTAWGRFSWSAYTFISGPLFLIGALFLVHWLHERPLTPLR